MWFVPGVAMTPIKGLVWLAETVRDQVEQEHEIHSHSARRLLDEIEVAQAAGEISDEEARQREREVLANIAGLPTAGDAARKTFNGDDR